MNRTLVNKVRCMLISSGLPSLFWGEALMMAVHLINLSPPTVLNFEIAKFMWSGKRPYYNILIIFYMQLMHLSHRENQNLGVHSVFLGYPQGVKGYRLSVRENSSFKVIISRDVIFYERTMPCKLINLVGTHHKGNRGTKYIELFPK